MSCAPSLIAPWLCGAEMLHGAMERCLVAASGCVCCADGTWGQSAPFTFHVTCAQALCLEEVLILWHQGPLSMLTFIIKIFPSSLR